MCPHDVHTVVASAVVGAVLGEEHVSLRGRVGVVDSGH